MDIEENKLLKIMSEAIKIGYTMCAVDLAVTPQYYTMKQAYKKHGRATVDKWISNADLKLEPVVRDKRLYLDRVKLDTIAATSFFN